MLEVGTVAPDFTLPDKEGNPVTLSQFRGKRVVVYFYPRDNTPGCTRQACAFGAAYGQFQALGVEVIGVSKDSTASHQRFAEKYNLPFLLLSDPELGVLQAYGVWQEKKLYGKVSMGVVRTTYLIDEEGVIVKAFGKVKAADNPAQMLAELSEDENFIADLIGLSVRTDEGCALGTVTDVIQTGANDVYCVSGEDGKEILLPAIKDCILKVDLEKQEMLVHVLPGLLDL